MPLIEHLCAAVCTICVDDIQNIKNHSLIQFYINPNYLFIATHMQWMFPYMLTQITTVVSPCMSKLIWLKWNKDWERDSGLYNFKRHRMCFDQRTCKYLCHMFTLTEAFPKPYFKFVWNHTPVWFHIYIFNAITCFCTSNVVYMLQSNLCLSRIPHHSIVQCCSMHFKAVFSFCVLFWSFYHHRWFREKMILCLGYCILRHMIQK